MTDRDAVLHALRSVYVHDYPINIVDAQLVRDCIVLSDRIALTLVRIVDEPFYSALEQSVRDALASWTSHTVHMRTRDATDAERSRFAQNSPLIEEKVGREPVTSAYPVIAICSGKGGVGKTTVAVNIAASLARSGFRIGLLDADMYGFSVPRMMGIGTLPAVDEEGHVYPVLAHGVAVMSMDFFVEDNAPVVWRGPMLGKMLHKFLHTIVWNGIHALIVDLPPGTGDVALDIHQMLPLSHYVVVTTPHDGAAYVATRAGAMALRTGHPILGVIENMSWFETETGSHIPLFGTGGGDDVAAALGTTVVGRVPLVPHVHSAVYDPSSTQGRRFDDLAHLLAQRIGLIAMTK